MAVWIVQKKKILKGSFNLEHSQIEKNLMARSHREEQLQMICSVLWRGEVC